MKKYIIIALDVILAGYLVFAIVAFNNPDHLSQKCTKVNIEIADQSTYGFLDAKEIKRILEQKGIYPIEKRMDDISPRQIEEVLNRSPFVNTTQCCKTKEGHVLISVTQRSPLVRIKSINGEDYYIDENGGTLPNSKYISDLIIVTGSVSKSFAQRYISILANIIMKSDLWRNQIEQINVLHDLGIELVPRVGDHIIFLGYLPQTNNVKQRHQDVTDYVETKLDRLEKFYLYGISKAGWNKYQRIDLQYDNQIICKKHPEHMEEISKPAVQEVHEADLPEVEAAAPSEHRAVATNVAHPTSTIPKKDDAKKQDVKKDESKKQETKKQPVSKPEPAKKETKKQSSTKSETTKQDTKKQEQKKKK